MSLDVVFVVVKMIEMMREWVNDIIDIVVVYVEVLVEYVWESEDEFFKMASKRVVETVRENLASAIAGVLMFFVFVFLGLRVLLW